MKVELHAHTSETSPCGRVSAKKLVKMYKDTEYDAIVITDHYSKWVMELNSIREPEELTEFFLEGYRCASRYAQDSGGIKVLLGAEVSLLESPNDYLLYGTDEEFFLKNHMLFEMTLSKLYTLCYKNNILLVQAHPYRAYCTPANTHFLDGVEVHNGNPRHDSNNDKAYKWAEKNKLLKTSGSDFHREEDVAKGGIVTEDSFDSIHELTEILKSGRYSIIS